MLIAHFVRRNVISVCWALLMSMALLLGGLYFIAS